MKLPNSERAVIPREKLVDYILSDTHPTGKFKARIFHKIGFNKSNVNALIKELKQVINSGEVTQEIVSDYGTKYIIDGQVKGLKGKIVKVRTIWIIEAGQGKPRFITVYPV